MTHLDTRVMLTGVVPQRCPRLPGLHVLEVLGAPVVATVGTLTFLSSYNPLVCTYVTGQPVRHSGRPTVFVGGAGVAVVAAAHQAP